jgi:transketolase
MRRVFADKLYGMMAVDDRIVFITADMGYGFADRIRDDFSTRFYNVGAAEQVMMDMAVGMALEGKIPVVYSITPFLLYRTWESIRNYLNHEDIHVVMVGSGRGKDYQDGGFSHDASDHGMLKVFENVEFIAPDTKDFDLNPIIYSHHPVYLNLKR